MAQLSVEELSEIFRKTVHYDDEEIESVLKDPNEYLFSLKVEQIKQVIRELKSKGYNLSVSANKPQLIKMVADVIRSIKGQTETVTAPSSANINPQPQSTIGKTHSTTTIPNNTLPQMHTSSTPKPLPTQGIRTNPALTYAVNTPLTLPPPTIRSTPGIRSTPAAPLPPQNAANYYYTKLTNAQDKQLFKQLSRELPGLPDKEIHEAITKAVASEGGHKTIDDIMLYIAMHREAGTDDGCFVPFSIEEENAQLDRAILESEKERENIQQRKKKRVEDMKEIQSLLCSAEELQRSILLWGVAKHVKHSSSSSSSSSAMSKPSTNTTNSTTKSTICSGTKPPTTLSTNTSAQGKVSRSAEDTLQGSYVIRLVALLFDYYGSRMISAELIALLEHNYITIRLLVLDLLLLETMSIKYYKDAPIPFLLSFIHALDNGLPLHSTATAAAVSSDHSFLPLTTYGVSPDEILRHTSHTTAFPSTATSASSSASLSSSALTASTTQKEKLLTACQHFLRDNYTFLDSLLTSYKTIFERGLAKIPKHEHSLVPDILRRKSLLLYAALLPVSMDADGFEIVQQSSAMNWMSDEEVDEEDPVDVDDDEEGDY